MDAPVFFRTLSLKDLGVDKYGAFKTRSYSDSINAQFGGKGRSGKEILAELLQRYGVLEGQSKYEMLLRCNEKATSQGNQNFKKDLVKAVEDFLEKKLSYDELSFEDLCREVVEIVPEDKWMRFVRLHLNLSEEEIQEFRRRKGTFNEEQKIQILDAFGSRCYGEALVEAVQVFFDTKNTSTGVVDREELLVDGGATYHGKAFTSLDFETPIYLPGDLKNTTKTPQ